MEPTTYLMLAALGGLVGLDAVSGPQVMISRPIIAGPLAGFLLGLPEAGMGVGVLLEILTLRHLPIGAARQWDTGPAAVVAASAVTILPAGVTSTLIAVGAGAVVGRFGSRTVQLMRQFNARLVAVERPIAPQQLTLRHLAAMGGDFARTQRGVSMGKRHTAPYLIGLFAAAILASSLNLLPIAVSLGAAITAMVVFGLLPLRELYEGIDWPVIVLLGALIPVGSGLQQNRGERLCALLEL